MAQTDYKSSTITLYVQRNDAASHWVSIVLAEKSVSPHIVFVEPDQFPLDLARINPNGSLPFLVDRGALRLYTPHIMVEYLEDRFPYPPLLPVYPNVRAQYRQSIYPMIHGWYSLLKQIESGKNKQEAEQLLQRELLKIAPLFEVRPYFSNDEFTMVDSCIAPILARLTQLNISLIKESNTLLAYQQRLFERPSFQDSLYQLEIEME